MPDGVYRDVDLMLTKCCGMFRMEKQRSLEAIRQCRKWVLKQKPKNNKKLKTREDKEKTHGSLCCGTRL